MLQLANQLLLTSYTSKPLPIMALGLKPFFMCMT